MKKETYEAMRRNLAGRPRADAFLSGAAVFLTAVVYAVYVCTGCILLLRKSRKIVPYLFIPGAVFTGGSLLRYLINAPRPYEQMDMKLHGSGKGDRNRGRRKTVREGESFPSRHSLSAAVIAVIFWWLSPQAGAAMGIIAVLIAVTRVLTGKHYIKDVLAGLAWGLAGGLAGLQLKNRYRKI